LQITIFGLTLSSAWANGHATPYRALIRALDAMGHRVRFYEKDAVYYARHRDFYHAPYGELVIYEDWDAVREEAMAQAAASDVVLVASYCPEGARISNEVLDLARPLKVFYDLDTPVTFAKFLTEGTTEYLEPKQIAEFDLVLSFTGGSALRKLEQEFGARTAKPLYGCVDPDVYRRVAAKPEWMCDLSYMGTYALDRQPKLEEFFLTPAKQMPENRFVLAGSMYPWPWYFPANVTKLEHIFPPHHAEMYSSSRMTLNITRVDMAESGYCPSGRFFEAAACGCPIVTDTWEGLETFFSDEEIVMVNSAGDVSGALRLEEGALQHLAERARQRTLEEHTGTRRAQQLLQYFEDARRGNPRAQSEVA
jgi:spore maturation protein CgeB